jgi:signal transduction histidine kinase
MERIVEDVLWLAKRRREIGSTETVALATVLEETWSLLTDSVPDADLIVERELDSCEIIADYDRLRQLLENLLSNAIDHGGEAVTVRAGRIADGFYIEDTGPGIPPDQRESAFSAGYTTAQDGTGLGLSIVDAVASAHGWEVEVLEGTDGGARFEITGLEHR